MSRLLLSYYANKYARLATGLPLTDVVEATLRGLGGVGLQVVGIGRNGHIGFNEPGASFDSRTRVVELSESTRKVNAADFEAARAPGRASSSRSARSAAGRVSISAGAAPPAAWWS